MRYPIPDGYTFSPDLAKTRHYSEENGVFSTKKNLREDGFVACVFLVGSEFEVLVKELPDEEEYLPFEVKDNKGTFVSEIREQVQEILDKVLAEVFLFNDMKTSLIDYMEETYNTAPEYPWEIFPTFATFKTSENGKWYALVGEVENDKLGIDGNGKSWFLNIKVNPLKREKIIDGKHFLPAYHMNKQHWITIVIDGDLDIDRAKNLIDNSYALVSGQKKSS